MERLSTPNKAPFGISANALRIWGLLFLTAGAVGRGLLQTRLLGVGSANTEQLLAAMDANMGAATAAIVLQIVEACAAPIFAFLLVEGFTHTKNFKNYLLRVLAVAVISEIPYNLAISGVLLNLESRNPAFGLVLGLVMLSLYARYPGKTLKNILIKVMVTAAALVWAKMLAIDSANCMVVILAGLWAFRKKPMLRTFGGALVTMLCVVMDPLYMVAPMGFLAVHTYNGEQGGANRVTNYAAYPALLLLVAGACWVVF